MAPTTIAPSTSLSMTNILSKPTCPDTPSKQPVGSKNSGPGAPPPTPSKIPLPPTPVSPITLKNQFFGVSNESQERPPLKTSTTTSSLAGMSAQGASASGYGINAQSNGFPSLVFPPATHQAYHTRNLLLHIYSMFNGAQAAIHQLGANCEFNQNLITFLSGQLVEKDRKIQTLTASVNMLQTAIQRAMKNNEELKKNEEGLQEVIKGLQSSSESDAESINKVQKEKEAELVAKIAKLACELRIQTEEKSTLVTEHNKKLGDLENEVSDLKENIEILEESLRYAVSLHFGEDGMEIDVELLPDSAPVPEQQRDDRDRAEKMMNGRLEDASAESDDSLIDEVNGVNSDYMISTDGASNGGYIAMGPNGRQMYLDSIMEEPEEEDKEDKDLAKTIAKSPLPPCAPPAQLALEPATVCNAPACTPGPRSITKLRATARPFVNEMEFHYINDENTKNEAEDSTLFL
ncbi:hypothetical protein TWF694_005892 [Orbilia ellipsospora]|uniref:Uncharacterized protein n=1 Tax=Orbilia ellipsospora TaxID=2528407 RepID=A0AAV9WS84_9PEZI